MTNYPSQYPDGGPSFRELAAYALGAAVGVLIYLSSRF